MHFSLLEKLIHTFMEKSYRKRWMRGGSGETAAPGRKILLFSFKNLLFLPRQSKHPAVRPYYEAEYSPCIAALKECYPMLDSHWSESGFPDTVIPVISTLPLQEFTVASQVIMETMILKSNTDHLIRSGGGGTIHSASFKLPFGASLWWSTALSLFFVWKKLQAFW